MRKVRAKLTEGPIGKTLFRMTLPMVWGILSIVGSNLTDTYFISQLGTRELAAISFTFPVVMFFASLAMGLGTGASSLISRVIGNGNQEQTKRLTTDSLSLSIFIVLIFICVGYFTIDPLFRLLGAEDELLPLIRDYMKIWYPGMIFLVVPMVGNSAIRATGDTKFPALIMTIAALTNLILDPILIFGLLGAPRLEMQGAALATVISRSITLFASLYVLHRKYGMLSFNRPRFQESWNSWKQIVKIGGPTAASNLIIPLSQGIITIFMASYGSKAVAAFGVVTRLESLAMLVVIALSSTLGPFVGQNWGAKKIDRVQLAVKNSFWFSLGWGVLLYLIFWLFSPYLIRLFSLDPQVLHIASLYLLTVSLSYGFSGVRLLASSTFNTLGRPIPSMVMIIGQTLAGYVPLAYLGSYLFGIHGVFIAIALANTVIGVIALFWTRRLFAAKSSALAGGLPPLTR